MIKKKWEYENPGKSKLYKQRTYAKNPEPSKAYSRRWYKNNRDQSRGNNIEFHKKNPLKMKEYDLKKHFGITLNDYYKMSRVQKHKCAICEKHRREFLNSLAVDHCHDTGKIRGLLCASCNTRLGTLENKNFMKKAKQYLKRKTI